MIEELLKLFICVVDTQLLEAIQLFSETQEVKIIAQNRFKQTRFYT